MVTEDFIANNIYDYGLNKMCCKAKSEAVELHV